MHLDLPLSIGDLQSFIRSFSPGANEEKEGIFSAMQAVIFLHYTERRFILVLQKQMRQHNFLWLISAFFHPFKYTCTGIDIFMQIHVETEVCGQTAITACTALVLFS